MTDDFPLELKQFIAQHVESLAQLEGLLILREDAQKPWKSSELCQRLYISPDTVKTHLEHIFEKLGASDRTAAVAEALRRRLIE